MQEEFDKRRAVKIDYHCEYFPKVLYLQEELTTSTAAIRQRAVTEAADALLKEPCSCCGGTVTQMERFRMVEVIDFESRYFLKVPEFQCDGTACPQHLGFSVEPIAAGCAPTAPTIDCLKWFSLGVLELFSDLHFHNGVSGAGKFPSFKFSHVHCVFLTPFTFCSLWLCPGQR